MKKKLLVLLLMGTMLLRFPIEAQAKAPDDAIFETMVKYDYYLTAGTVTDVVNGEYVTILLPDGNLYSFWGDGWQRGDIVALMMDGKGTSTIKDDAILLAQPVRR